MKLDYITTRDDLNDVNKTAQRRREKRNDEDSKRNEISEATGTENSEWPYPKTLPDPPKNQKNLQKKNLLMKRMHKSTQMWGMILSRPKYLSPGSDSNKEVNSKIKMQMRMKKLAVFTSLSVHQNICTFSR